MTHALALPIPSTVGNIDAYIHAANRYPMLSEAEESRLAERLHKGSEVLSLCLRHCSLFGRLYITQIGVRVSQT